MKQNDKITEAVHKFKSGEEQAFSIIYEETYKYLYTCAIHIVKDDDIAQDMIQEAYLEIYKHIEQLNKASDFLSWAATITNRKCFRYLQKKSDILVDNQTDDEGNETNYFDSIADDESFIPENIFDNQAKIQIIKDIIDDLTDVQRACVIGYFYNEQKQEEIATELNIPVNTVKSHLSRAKAKIKEAVGDVEKKQGIKLLSVVPFMLIFFTKETEVYAAEMTIPAMGSALSGAVTAHGTAVTGATSVGATSTSTTASGLSGAKATATGVKAAKTVTMAARTKIIAGVTAGAVAVGGIGAGIYLNNRYEQEPIVIGETVEKTEDEPIMDDQVGEVEENEIIEIDAYIDLKKMMDDNIVYGSNLSEIDDEWIHDYWESQYKKFLNMAEYPNVDNYTSSVGGEEKKPEEGTSIYVESTNQTFTKSIFPEGVSTEGTQIKSLYGESYLGIDHGENDEWDKTTIQGSYNEYVGEDGIRYKCLSIIDIYRLEWTKTIESDDMDWISISFNQWMDDLINDGEESCIQISSNIVGNNIMNYLNSLYPGLYALSLENNEIYYTNGLMKNNGGYWSFSFDDEVNGFRQVDIGVQFDGDLGRINEVSFSKK